MSPETAVAAERRKMFTDSYVKQKLMLVAIDEAHCIHEWLVLYMCAVRCIHLFVGVWNLERFQAYR